MTARCTLEDNTLLCLEAFKDFSVPCDVEDFEPTEEMMSFWARPSIARTQDLEISETEMLYGREGDADQRVQRFKLCNNPSGIYARWHHA